jgi:hypothetical protein
MFAMCGAMQCSKMEACEIFHKRLSKKSGIDPDGGRMQTKSRDAMRKKKM